jgi:DNA-binding protein HU-beta
VNSSMISNDLTLDEMFALEREHTPFVGCKTSVFLEPAERANASARRVKGTRLSHKPKRGYIISSSPRTGARVFAKSQIVASITEKCEISKKQAAEILDHIAQLAYKHAKHTFMLPGIGKLVLEKHPSRHIRMQFGPKKGQAIRIPAKRVVKFRVAKAAKDAILRH